MKGSGYDGVGREGSPWCYTGSGGAWLSISAQLTGSRCLTKWISGGTEFSAVRHPERNPWHGRKSGVLGAFRGALW